MKRITTLLLLMVISLSAFSTLVTFKVDMRGSGVEYDTIFIVGIHTEWIMVMMEEDDAADSIYTATFNLDEGDSTAFYFITIGYWPDDGSYLDYREPAIPDECDYSMEYAGWEGDRGIVVPAGNTTYAYVWGTCDVPPEYNAIRETRSDIPSFVIFPNPADESVTLNWTGVLENGLIEIIDLSGKTIRSLTLQGSVSSYQINISDISPGVYLIRVSDGTSSEYRKIIKN